MDQAHVVGNRRVTGDIMVRRIAPTVKRGIRTREGKGFSKAELAAVDLTLGRAKTMGIPMDHRRGSSHEENIKVLKEFLKDEKNLEKVKKPKMTSKPHTGRAYRGKTSAGQKVRGLSRKK